MLVVPGYRFGPAADAVLQMTVGEAELTLVQRRLADIRNCVSGVVEGVMDPGRPSLLKHAHRFVEHEASVATIGATHL
jgi:hypothetical protein